MDRIRNIINYEARAFFEIAEKEYRTYSIDLTNLKVDDFYKIIPVIVNLALSIELYLKGFQVRARGHDLEALFFSSPDWLQKSVVNAYIVSQNQLDNDKKISDNDFFRLLKVNAKAFEDWRYFYERGSDVNVGLLYTLAKILNNLYSTINGMIN